MIGFSKEFYRRTNPMMPKEYEIGDQLFVHEEDGKIIVRRYGMHVDLTDEEIERLYKFHKGEL